MCSNGERRTKTRKAKRERKEAVRKYELSANEGEDRVLLEWESGVLGGCKSSRGDWNYAEVEQMVQLGRCRNEREGGLCTKIYRDNVAVDPRYLVMSLEEGRRWWGLVLAI